MNKSLKTSSVVHTSLPQKVCDICRLYEKGDRIKAKIYSHIKSSKTVEKIEDE